MKIILLISILLINNIFCYDYNRGYGYMNPNHNYHPTRAGYRLTPDNNSRYSQSPTYSSYHYKQNEYKYMVNNDLLNAWIKESDSSSEESDSSSSSESDSSSSEEFISYNDKQRERKYIISNNYYKKMDESEESESDESDSQFSEYSSPHYRQNKDKYVVNNYYMKAEEKEEEKKEVEVEEGDGGMDNGFFGECGVFGWRCRFRKSLGF